MNIIKFKLKNRPTRQQAIQWLAQNYDKFPTVNNFISENIFHGYRFVVGYDDITYFANCIDEGITENELLNLKKRFGIIKQNSALYS